MPDDEDGRCCRTEVIENCQDGFRGTAGRLDENPAGRLGPRTGCNQPRRAGKEDFEMTRDSVCGMTVDDPRYRSMHAGQIYAFCSAACKAKFDKDSARYAAAAVAEARQAGRT